MDRLARRIRDPHRRPPSPPTALPFRVRTLGRVRGQPYHSTPGTHHDDAMLTVVLAGRGRYLWPGGSVAVRAGMVGLVRPGPGSGVLMAEPGDPYDHVYCRFAGGEAMRIVQRVAEAQHGSRFFAHRAWEEIAAVLLRALTRGVIQAGVDEGRMARVDGVLAEALALLEAPAEEDLPPGPPSASQLLAYLHDRVAEPTDLSRMSAHFGYSKSHLCRIARAALGTTIQRAWEDARMERARVLLAQRTPPIAEVARRTGYADPAYFANVFRRRVGVAPSAYREASID